MGGTKASQVTLHSVLECYRSAESSWIEALKCMSGVEWQWRRAAKLTNILDICERRNVGAAGSLHYESTMHVCDKV